MSQAAQMASTASADAAAPGLSDRAIPSLIDDTVRHELQIAGAAAATFAADMAIYVDQLSSDLATAAGGLAGCRTPLDVLAVEQGYLLARAQAWLDSAYRMFERCVEPSYLEGSKDRAADPFVLPD